METTIAMLACLVAVVALFVAIYGQYSSRKQIAQFEGRLRVRNNEQDKKMTETEAVINSLRKNLMAECLEYTHQQTDTFKAEQETRMEEETQNVRELTNELFRLQNEVASQFDGMLDWRQEVEKTLGIQVENQGVFVDHVRAQLEDFAKRSRSLPEQLDEVSGKLEQIRRLKRELIEVQQPIQLDDWKEGHQFQDELVTEGAV